MAKNQGQRRSRLEYGMRKETPQKAIRDMLKATSETESDGGSAATILSVARCVFAAERKGG